MTLQKDQLVKLFEKRRELAKLNGTSGPITTAGNKSAEFEKKLTQSGMDFNKKNYEDCCKEIDKLKQSIINNGGTQSEIDELEEPFISREGNNIFYVQINEQKI